MFPNFYCKYASCNHVDEDQKTMQEDYWNTFKASTATHVEFHKQSNVSKSVSMYT